MLYRKRPLKLKAKFLPKKKGDQQIFSPQKFFPNFLKLFDKLARNHRVEHVFYIATIKPLNTNEFKCF